MRSCCCCLKISDCLFLNPLLMRIKAKGNPSFISSQGQLKHWENWGAFLTQQSLQTNRGGTQTVCLFMLLCRFNLHSPFFFLCPIEELPHAFISNKKKMLLQSPPCCGTRLSPSLNENDIQTVLQGCLWWQKSAFSSRCKSFTHAALLEKVGSKCLGMSQRSSSDLF